MQLEKALQNTGVSVEPYGHSTTSILGGMLLRRPHILHIQWLDAFFTAKFFLFACLKLMCFKMMIFLMKRGGIKIVWTVHNLHDHEHRNPRLDRHCTQFMINSADALILHGPSASRELQKTFVVSNLDKIRVIPHGHYRQAYENKITREAARNELGLDAKTLIFLFLGQIRPYKGLSELLDAFRALTTEEIGLVIAGKTRDVSSSRTLIDNTSNDPRITYHPGFVPDERIQVYLKAADVVVFPYRDILTSGGVLLAMSFGRACLAPRMGCIPDVLDDQGAILYDPDQTDGLYRALASTIERRSELDALGAYNLQRTDAWGWDHVGNMTAEVYHRVMAST